MWRGGSHLGRGFRVEGPQSSATTEGSKAPKRCTAQEWFAAHFPTREVFAPLAAFLLRVAPAHEARLAAFQAASFGAALTVGVQVGAASAAFICRFSWRCTTPTPSSSPGGWVGGLTRFTPGPGACAHRARRADLRSTP